MSLAVAIQMDPIVRHRHRRRQHLLLWRWKARSAATGSITICRRTCRSATAGSGRPHAGHWRCAASTATTTRSARCEACRSGDDGRRADAPGPAFRHGLHHGDPPARACPPARPWWSTIPVQVRNAPEKLFVTHFTELMPPTLITSDRDEIVDFRARAQGHHRQAAVRQRRRRGVSHHARTTRT